jgi:hypothetical protein
MLLDSIAQQLELAGKLNEAAQFRRIHPADAVLLR